MKYTYNQYLREFFPEFYEKQRRARLTDEERLKEDIDATVTRTLEPFKMSLAALDEDDTNG